MAPTTWVWVALHQDHVRALDCHIGAGTDRKAHVGLGKGRRIVDAVADHADLVVCLRAGLENEQVRPLP